ncbi:MAG: hypothetical protein RL095_3315 [Verrucomicrobiota bacterium]|jgi:voltage-gated potassium channel
MISLRQKLHSVFFALGLLLVWLLVGVIGFHSLGDSAWTWLDAFYMAVITLASVGYTEVHPFTPALKLFASCYIIGGCLCTVYALARVAQFVFEGELKEILGVKKRKRVMESLNQHVIICGYGRMGRSISEGLLQHSRDLVVIENNPALVPLFLEQGIKHVIGDATEEMVLREAGIERAKTLLVVLPNDAANLYIVLTARELNPELRIITHCHQESAEKRLLRAGANEVVYPYRVASNHILKSLE